MKPIDLVYSTKITAVDSLGGALFIAQFAALIGLNWITTIMLFPLTLIIVPIIPFLLVYFYLTKKKVSHPFDLTCIWLLSSLAISFIAGIGWLLVVGVIVRLTNATSEVSTILIYGTSALMIVIFGLSLSRAYRDTTQKLRH